MRDSATRRMLVALSAAACLAATVAGCGASAKRNASTPKGSGTPASAAHHGGAVAVSYAGSLVNLMEKKIGPRFEAATGYTLEGFAGGSEALAKEIKAKVRQADVFVSAAPAPDESLTGAKNGAWVSWYATFARSPLLIAYRPSSRFAPELKRERWWKVLTQPGFELGRTDPKLDPKGALTVKALDRAASEHHDPALRRLTETTSGVFPEEALIGRLQAGQLDAGFFYSVEAAAVQPHLPTISIAPIHLAASYTVTIPRGARNEAGAVAFIDYLLSPAERAALTAAGLKESGPSLTGARSAVPSALRKTLAPTS